MKVLLINPFHPYQEGVPLPLGLSYLAAVLEERGVETQILDLMVSRLSQSEILRKVEESEADVVGSTSVTMTFPSAAEILRICKKKNQEITTVIGGPHVTFTAEETLKENPWIDFVVIGEGEYTLLELVEAVENEDDFRSVKGIAYRKNGEVIFTAPRPPIEDLDELPLPARHLFPLSKYRALQENCNLITSRGCPWRCIFCTGPKIHGRKVRYRDPKLVVDEMETIKELDFDINVADDTFTLNHRHVYAILDEMMDRGLNIKWTAFSRVDTLKKDLLKRMKEAGCHSIFFGVESGDQGIVNTTKKGIKLGQVRKAVGMAKEAKIHPVNSFILGLPGETHESLKKTLNLACELNTEFTIHLLAPLPGSELYEKADEYGIRMLTDDWAKYNANEPVTETITADGKVGSEELASTFSQYIDICDFASEEIMEKAKEGEEPSIGMARKWETLDFVTRLLEKSLIEKMGKIGLNGIAFPTSNFCMEELERKISDVFDGVSYSIKQKLKEQVGEGNLTYNFEEIDGKNFLVWRWSKT